MNIQELIHNVEQWAEKRNLLHYENAPKQYLKFIEECGETARAILKNDEDNIIDGFGDIAVTAIILAKQLKTELRSDFVDFGKYKKADFSWFVRKCSEKIISGDILEYISHVSNFYGYSLQQCLNSAWNEIKDREGKTENGVFTKSVK